MWSPNITIGINFLMIAAKILKNIAPYTDIEIVEEHFKAKPEVSGTARKIAAALGLPEESIKTVRAGGLSECTRYCLAFPIRPYASSMNPSPGKHSETECSLPQAIGDKDVGLYTMEDLLLPYFNIGSSYESR